MLIIWRAELGSTRIEMDSKTLAVPVKARGASGLAILALLTTFAGVGLLIDRPKGSIPEWLGIPFIVLGGAIFAWAVWPFHPSDLETNTLANRLLRWLTWDGKLVRSFPAIGVGMALADISYNLALSATPALQTEDTIVLLTASAFIAYEFVPKRFARERDFALIFFRLRTSFRTCPSWLPGCNSGILRSPVNFTHRFPLPREPAPFYCFSEARIPFTPCPGTPT